MILVKLIDNSYMVADFHGRDQRKCDALKFRIVPPNAHAGAIDLFRSWTADDLPAFNRGYAAQCHAVGKILHKLGRDGAAARVLRGREYADPCRTAKT